MLGMASCTSTANKSITEPLNAEERQELSGAGYFPIVLTLGEKLLPEEQARFKKITYRRANDFLVAYQNWDTTEAEAEWNEKYQSKLDSVDGIIAAYMQEVEDNLPEKIYATVDWKTSVSEDGMLTDKADITFTITPKQPIEEFFLMYGIVSRTDSASMGKFSTLQQERNTLHGTNLTGRKTYRTTLHYRDKEVDEKDFNKLTSEQLKEKYYWGMMFRVKIDGKWYSRSDYVETLPKSVQRYLKDRRNASGWETYGKKLRTKEVAEDFFEVKIPEKADFMSTKQKEAAKASDGEVYELFEALQKDYSIRTKGLK